MTATLPRLVIPFQYVFARPHTCLTLFLSLFIAHTSIPVLKVLSVTFALNKITSFIPLFLCVRYYIFVPDSLGWLPFLTGRWVLPQGHLCKWLQRWSHYPTSPCTAYFTRQFFIPCDVNFNFYDALVLLSFIMLFFSHVKLFPPFLVCLLLMPFYFYFE